MKSFVNVFCWTLLTATSALSLSAGEPPAKNQFQPPPPGPYYRVENQNGIWWFIDPNGKRFISLGVNTIQPSWDAVRGNGPSLYENTVRERYGSVDKWRKAVVERLMGWKYNTIGAWSDYALAQVEVNKQTMAHTPILHLSEAYLQQRKRDNKWNNRWYFADVFDPLFEQICLKTAREKCAPLINNRGVLGWFTDNELRWGPDWRGSEELLTMFMSMPVDSAGRRAALATLKERYKTFDDFRKVYSPKRTQDKIDPKTGQKTNEKEEVDCITWAELEAGGSFKAPFTRKAVYMQNQGEERDLNNRDPKRAAFTGDCDAFLAKVSERYFEVTHRAVRQAAPNHLDLGCRFAYLPSLSILPAAGKHLDVISFNCYYTDPKGAIAAFASYGRPVLIGEYCFRSKDSGLPNTKGAGTIVATQKERAEYFTRYAEGALAHPGLVGLHWFQHADQPKEGRGDGENSNNGLVDIKDNPYETLVNAMTILNGQAEALHAKATKSR